MKARIIIASIFFLLLSTSSIAQSRSELICFNHFALVLDSTTYHEAVNSAFLNRFAFAEEKELPGYTGFYLIGQTNYIELFHPRSFDGFEEEEGGMWMCLASLKANYIQELNPDSLDFIQLTADDQYESLEFHLNDSINPITVREMNKEQYESWTKKAYHDSISFLPVDYNSPAEADSSTHYLMNDVVGIGMRVQIEDFDKVIRYLLEIGFHSRADYKGYTKLYKGHQYVELYPAKGNAAPTISRFYLRLNEPVESSKEIIGNSTLMCNGVSATWIFD